MTRRRRQRLRPAACPAAAAAAAASAGGAAPGRGGSPRRRGRVLVVGHGAEVRAAVEGKGFCGRRAASGSARVMVLAARGGSQLGKRRLGRPRRTGRRGGGAARARRRGGAWRGGRGGGARGGGDGARRGDAARRGRGGGGQLVVRGGGGGRAGPLRLVDASKGTAQLVLRPRRHQVAAAVSHEQLRRPLLPGCCHRWQQSATLGWPEAGSEGHGELARGGSGRASDSAVVPRHQGSGQRLMAALRGARPPRMRRHEQAVLGAHLVGADPQRKRRADHGRPVQIQAQVSLAGLLRHIPARSSGRRWRGRRRWRRRWRRWRRWWRWREWRCREGAAPGPGITSPFLTTTPSVSQSKRRRQLTTSYCPSL